MTAAQFVGKGHQYIPYPDKFEYFINVQSVVCNSLGHVKEAHAAQ